MGALLAEDLQETPIDRLLRSEQEWETPVERYAKIYDAKKGAISTPFFQDLVPLNVPGEKEQYAFEVNLDACSGCKACVSACHSLNGLDSTEAWRDVGTLSGGDRTNPFLQTVTTACHHCEEPACMHGCPVLAYEKDPITGIVLHLDDQCIGCSYCVLKCPYDVPKYNPSLGIVRKCDLCHNRMANHEAPACAQACPTEAIKVTIVQQGLPDRCVKDFLPDTIDPGYTRPTTQYITKKEIPENAIAGDHFALHPQHAHWSLIFLLVFTQASVGFSVASLFTPNNPLNTWIALALGLTGLGLGTFHLGKPLKAWRSFLGWRRSWLSREIIAFGAYIKVLALAVGIPIFFPQWEFALQGSIVAAALLGILGVYCSVMIYVDTQRILWRFSRSGLRFFGTVALSAASGLALTGSTLGTLALIPLLLFKLGYELQFLKAKNHPTFTPDKESALIQLNEKFRLGIRFVLALVALCLLIPSYPTLAGIAFVLILTGEHLERYFYFRSVVAPKMPGGIQSGC